MTEAVEKQVEKSYEELSAQVVELREAVEAKHEELQDLARQKAELVADEPSAEVADLLGNQLPRCIVKGLKQN